MKQRKAVSKELQDKASIFKHVTALHGTNHFSHKKGKQLFLWALLMIVNIVLTISFLLVITKAYNNDQIVTKVSSVVPQR